MKYWPLIQIMLLQTEVKLVFKCIYLSIYQGVDIEEIIKRRMGQRDSWLLHILTEVTCIYLSALCFQKCFNMIDWL